MPMLRAATLGEYVCVGFCWHKPDSNDHSVNSRRLIASRGDVLAAICVVRSCLDCSRVVSLGSPIQTMNNDDYLCPNPRFLRNMRIPADLYVIMPILDRKPRFPVQNRLSRRDIGDSRRDIGDSRRELGISRRDIGISGRDIDDSGRNMPIIHG